MSRLNSAAPPAPILTTTRKWIAAATIAGLSLAGALTAPIAASAASPTFGSVAGQNLPGCFDITLPRGDDNQSDPAPLPRPFTYKGRVLTQYVVSTNGFVQFFGAQSETYSGVTLYADGTDLDTYGTGLVTYGFEPDGSFCAVWDSVGYFPARTDRLNTFQIVVTPQTPVLEGSNADFDVTYNYDSLRQSFTQVLIDTSNIDGVFYVLPGDGGEFRDDGSQSLIAGSRLSSTKGRYVFPGVSDSYTASLASAAISGQATRGSTLTAVPGTFRPSTANLRYQWLRDGGEIADATGSTYSVSDTDSGHSLSVRITVYADESAQDSKTSETVAIPALMSPSKPVVAGSPAVDSVLTADTTGWEPAESAFAYQWTRDGDEIAGATDATYTVTTADGTHSIGVSVTGSAAGYEDASRSSDGIYIPGTLASAKPVVEGGIRLGDVRTALPGEWSSTATLNYQWTRDGVAVDGATSSTYTVTTDDQLHDLGVTVSGSAEGYNDTVRSSDATYIPADLVSSKPIVSGAAKVGSVLTATPGEWSTDANLTYQWTRDGAAIEDATAATYTIVAADAKHSIAVVVTGELKGYTSASETSDSVTIAALVTGLPAKKLTVGAPSAFTYPGKSIAVTARGLAAREAYSISIAGKKVATGRADANGRVSRSVVVPKTSRGTHTVTVVGSTSKRSGKDSISVVEKSKKLTITAKPSPIVEANRTLTITVRGLAAGEPVTVTYKGKRVSPKSAVANSNGSYTVKVSAGWSWGYKAITATGVNADRFGKARIDVEARTNG